jgi:hypothetical protein
MLGPAIASPTYEQMNLRILVVIEGEPILVRKVSARTLRMSGDLLTITSANNTPMSNSPKPGFWWVVR